MPTPCCPPARPIQCPQTPNSFSSTAISSSPPFKGTKSRPPFVKPLSCTASVLGESSCCPRNTAHRGFGIKSGDVASGTCLVSKPQASGRTNRARGEPHQATIALFDPYTGRPLCIMDGNAITTARTGAAGALGLQQLARPKHRDLRLWHWSTGDRAAQVCAEHAAPAMHRPLREHFGEPNLDSRWHFVTIAPSALPMTAMKLLPIATWSLPPHRWWRAVRRSSCPAGTHLTCVGTDTAGKAGASARRAATCPYLRRRPRAGPHHRGCQWAPELPCTEIGGLLAGTAPFERSASDITVFDMTGTALQDLTVARFLYEHALAKGTGTGRLAMVSDITHPSIS